MTTGQVSGVCLTSQQMCTPASLATVLVMNTFILFDSQFGNTEEVARIIAGTLEAEGSTRVERVADVSAGDLKQVDLLVLGCPTQAWQMTKAMKAFLERLPDAQFTDVSVACFDTRIDKPRLMTGSAAYRIAARLRKLGAHLIAPPENFLVEGTEGPLVEGERDHAAAWARDIAHTIRAQRKMTELVGQAT